MAWRGPLSVALIAAALLSGCGEPAAVDARAQLRDQRAELQRRIADSPGALDARIDLIRILFRLDDGVGAEAAAKAALAAGDDAAVLRPLLARAYAMQGDGRRALAELDAGPIAPAMMGEAAWVAANVHLANGDLAAARDAFDYAVRARPDDSMLWVDVARFRGANADVRGAREAVDHAIALDAANGAALAYKAGLVRQEEGPAAALRWYEAALAADPYDGAARIEQAATLGDLGRYRDMLTALRRAAVQRPGDARLYYLQAVLAARADNYRLARSLLQRTRGALDAEPGFMLLSAVVELRLGGEAVAATWAERLVAAQPNNLAARRILAVANWADGDADGAADALAPLVRRADADSWSLMLAARVAAERGRAGDAAEFLARAATLTRGDAAPFATGGDGFAASAADADPLNPARVIPAVAADIAAGNGTRAIERATRLRDANRGVAEAHILLGDAALAAGRLDLAVQAYRGARALDAGERTTLRLANALYRAGDGAGSAAAIRDLLGAQPSNLAAHRLAGHLALDAGDWDAAIAHFERVRARIGDRDAELLRELARAWAAKGEGDRALPFIAQAYRLQPLNAEIMQIYAAQLAARGEGQAAADLRDKAAQIGR